MCRLLPGTPGPCPGTKQGRRRAAPSITAPGATYPAVLYLSSQPERVGVLLTVVVKSRGDRAVDVALVIRERLLELGLEQRDLARAARVTESYISQLLTGKKASPAPDRTDIYDRMDRFLKLPAGELARVAELARKEELKRKLGDRFEPLLPDVRELILRTCRA